MDAHARVKERPILFSGPMVRALLEGRKTQTRRIINAGKEGRPEALDMLDAGFTPVYVADTDSHFCPYGKPGDRLWVRETWHGIRLGDDPNPCSGGYLYRADMRCNRGDDWTGIASETRWKPSIHMPRRASRILLEIVSVRVERLQDIREADAIQEGFKGVYAPPLWVGYDPYFQPYWEKLNGKESWDVNPWVWAVEFKRVET